MVVDYFGVFENLEKALNFDESIREESLIDWEALKATVPGEVARCMELFKGIQIADTRECLSPLCGVFVIRRLPRTSSTISKVLNGSGKLSRRTRVSTRASLYLQLALQHLHRLPSPPARQPRDLRRTFSQDTAAH